MEARGGWAAVECVAVVMGLGKSANKGPDGSLLGRQAIQTKVAACEGVAGVGKRRTGFLV